MYLLKMTYSLAFFPDPSVTGLVGVDPDPGVTIGV